MSHPAMHHSSGRVIAYMQSAAPLPNRPDLHDVPDAAHRAAAEISPDDSASRPAAPSARVGPGLES